MALIYCILTNEEKNELISKNGFNNPHKKRGYEYPAELYDMVIDKNRKIQFLKLSNMIGYIPAIYSVVWKEHYCSIYIWYKIELIEEKHVAKKIIKWDIKNIFAQKFFEKYEKELISTITEMFSFFIIHHEQNIKETILCNISKIKYVENNSIFLHIGYRKTGNDFYGFY